MLGVAVLLASLGSAFALDASRYLWYTSQGTNFASGLPIGNGRVAGLVYGSARERVSLNENSIWSGPFTDRLNNNSASWVPTIRSQLQAGNLTTAGSNVLTYMANQNHSSPTNYQVWGELQLDFGHSGTLSSYTRSLDTLNGIASVSYNYSGRQYTREYLASYPSNVLAVRLAAPNSSGAVTVKVTLYRSQNVVSQTATISNGVNSVKLRGSSTTAGITFASEARVVNNGGSVAVSGSSIQVTGANYVDIFLDARSTYRHSSVDVADSTVQSNLAAAVSKGYDSIRSAHISDYSSIIGRVKLDLGSSSQDNTPTDTRVTNYKNNPGGDVQLVTLMFNFGRHCLLSSSRKSTDKALPANLQGIWNEAFFPSWGSKYTININIQMIHWASTTTNMLETQEALFDLIDTTLPRGQVAASRMYGCSGFVAHHNVDLWGDSAPVDYGTPYTMWPMGSVWLVLHMMEQYRFNLDKTFLSNRAWPMLKQVASFYYCYLFQYNGYYETGPSISPENTFTIPSNMRTAGSGASIDIGPTMDLSLLWELFTAVIEAATALNITGTDLTNAQNYRSKLRTPPISGSNRIQEWRNDYAETDRGHRHLSHLFGLHPGSQITPLGTSSLATAAKNSLDSRVSGGSGSTGWSRAWLINMYARVFAGSTVWTHIVALLQKYPTANLFNTDNGPGTTMQLDGNLGFTAGVAEALLQSHGGFVHILPALFGSAVPKGSVTGLLARGGFVVDITWSGGQFASAKITSQYGSKLALRVAGGTTFYVNGLAYTGAISTTAGGVYYLGLTAGTSISTTTTTTTTTTSTTTTTTTTSTGTGCTVAKWGQCGGIGYTGCTTCASGSTCTYSNDWYSQCL